MSSEISRIKAIIDKTKSGSTIRVQGETVSALISQVGLFVDAIKSDQDAVRAAKNIPREIQKLEAEGGKEAEIAQARQAESDAREVEKTLAAKKQVLRSLEGQVDSLRSSIQKGLNA